MQIYKHQTYSYYMRANALQGWAFRRQPAQWLLSAADSS